jgi:hypothetical protein
MHVEHIHSTVNGLAVLLQIPHQQILLQQLPAQAIAVRMEIAILLLESVPVALDIVVVIVLLNSVLIIALGMVHVPMEFVIAMLDIVELIVVLFQSQL